MRRSKNNILLYIGMCAALLPILLLRDFTPANELRYLSIADEALRDHTFFTFSNHGVPYTDKPPLYLWIVMFCRRLTGEHRMWLLALFSLLPAWGIVRTMDRWVIQELDSEGRIQAKLMLLTCGLFLGTAVTLRMDMLMCFFIVLALRTFWRMTKEEGHSELNRRLFPLYLFLAVFTKGPIGLLVPLCGTTVYLVARRRIGEFFRYWGGRTWGILSACCVLWLGMVYAEGGADYLHDLLFRQTVGRAVNSFHHAEPFYYYAVCIWYCLAPWSLLVAGVVAAALHPKFVRSDLQCFFLAIGITTFVLLSCISSKLQIYLLPALPFLIYATAMFLPRFRENGGVRMALAVPAAAFTLALPAMIVLTATGYVPYLHEGTFYVAAAVLTLCGAHSLYILYNRRRTTNIAGTIRHMGTGLLLALFVGGWTLPKLNAYTGYGTLCRKALELSQEKGIGEIKTWHLSRSENIDVYLHRPVTAVEDDETPASGNDNPCLLLTHKRYLDKFPGMETYTIGPYAVVVLKKGNR